MTTAAVALALGWSDPMALLSLDHDDWLIACAVIDQAADLDARRRGLEVG